MSEKKNTKIGIGEFAVILLVIIIALVIIAGIVIIKKNAESEITSGEEKIASLEKQIETIKEQEKQKAEASNNNKQVSYSDIVGVYEGKTNEKMVRIWIYANGTYKSDFSVVASDDIYNHAGGEIGNYIIQDNKIKLNRIFKLGSDAGEYSVEKGSLEYTINSNNAIVTNEKITLNKTDYNLRDSVEDTIKEYVLND